MFGRCWSPSDLVRRAREVVGKQGAKALWFKVLGELCYRRVYLFKDRLEVDYEVSDARVPLEVRPLVREELPEYLSKAPPVKGREITSRLDAGHICHTAWSEGALIGYVWSAVGRAPVDYMGVAMELPTGAVYGYELFVHADWRKLGVSVAMIRERRTLLLKSGYHTGYSVLMPENTPAVNVQQSVKRYPIGMMRVVWFGPWRRAWLRLKDATAPQPFGIAR